MLEKPLKHGKIADNKNLQLTTGTTDNLGDNYPDTRGGLQQNTGL